MIRALLGLTAVIAAGCASPKKERISLVPSQPMPGWDEIVPFDMHAPLPPGYDLEAFRLLELATGLRLEMLAVGVNDRGAYALTGRFLYHPHNFYKTLECADANRNGYVTYGEADAYFQGLAHIPLESLEVKLK
jgi:hypothetical protein